MHETCLKIANFFTSPRSIECFIFRWMVYCNFKTSYLFKSKVEHWWPVSEAYSLNLFLTLINLLKTYVAKLISILTIFIQWKFHQGIKVASKYSIPMTDESEWQIRLFCFVDHLNSCAFCYLWKSKYFSFHVEPTHFNGNSG